MKINIIDKTGKKVGDYDFKITESIRNDIFKKAVRSEFSFFRQNTGASLQAGKRNVINVSKMRRKFRSTYGKGGSRTPVKTMWRRGMQLRFVGAFASNTIGGRRAHPPKAEKNIMKDINNKEWFKALKIGLVSSFDFDTVLKNGQKIPSKYPIILDDSLEKINKTKEFKEFLLSLGLDKEIERIYKRKVRAGKGTMRNRTYKKKRGPLVVVSSMESNLFKAAKNIRGFEVITPQLLMVSDLGMSEKPGRAVLFSKSAIDEVMEVFN